jgi:hypothetical protein
VGEPVFFQADTWYYAIDAETQAAMAVRFRNGVARAVEIFTSKMAGETRA